MSSVLRVLDAARAVEGEIDEIIDRLGSTLIVPDQLRRAVGAIGANIREGYGRREGAERNQFLRYARGSAEETDEHLRRNFKRKRIDEATYWRLHNRLATIVRMLTALMRD